MHLLRTDENDHVELHEVRGFMADDLAGALREAYAVSKGTRCQQFLFSLSLSPPKTERVPVETFEAAIADIEAKLKLTEQPRAIIFHEKQGRRHAHCVWSRIDAKAMKAINLPHFKLKLRDLSRALYIDHGWRMPQGLVNSAEADPRNFTPAEWQQAKRAEQDPAALKALFQDCWAISDSRKAFAQALAARGFYLAQGDRRGFVAVDVKGEVYAVARWVGIPTRQVRDRLGNASELPSVAETKVHIANLLKETLGRHLAGADADYSARSEPLSVRKAEMVRQHRQDRAKLRAAQQTRSAEEARQRAQRFRSGLRGLWDRVTGRHSRTKQENEADAQATLARDGDERQTLIDLQLNERRQLHQQVMQLRTQHTREITVIHRDLVSLDPDGQTQLLGPTVAQGVSREAPGQRNLRGPSPT